MDNCNSHYRIDACSYTLGTIPNSKGQDYQCDLINSLIRKSPNYDFDQNYQDEYIVQQDLEQNKWYNSRPYGVQLKQNEKYYNWPNCKIRGIWRK